MKTTDDQKMDKIIGSYLRMYREKADLTQEDVGNRMGVTKMAISGWESGRRTISARSMFEFLHAVGIDPNEAVKRMAREVGSYV